MGRVSQWATGPAADMVVRFLVLLSLVFGVFMYAGYKDLADCVARYNNQNAAATEARARAAERERLALDNYVFSLDGLRKLPPAEAQAQARAAFDAFVQARREASKAREDNPPPPPPSESCDD